MTQSLQSARPSPFDADAAYLELISKVTEPIGEWRTLLSDRAPRLRSIELSAGHAA